ncbi:glycosyltransferase [Pedobacter yonginense]|uniref:Glycosyltransferase n=2 Tax=Pedobacter yonginense TaxID=651869 RepID=A0A317EU19_9SPHI|nr:glycosyltransferase [Pedobacter yonginense]
MIQLIDLFLDRGYEITFATAASKSDFSYDFSNTVVTEQEIKLNDESFDSFLSTLHPSIVLFDRFMIEEQYGWRVKNECPEALLILDTEDLHFLRQARQKSKKQQKSIELFSDTAKRELASILRCDLSLIISEEEMKILTEQFKIDASLIYYLPFLESAITTETTQNWVSFEDRAGLAFIGNFIHEPNWDTVQLLKSTVWPALRTKLPNVSLNIYGAYVSPKVLQLANERENFNIKGRAKDARETLSKHKILIAPIQFGAGLKGKFIDAIHVGTPSATTSMGAEAMRGDLNWNGIIEDDLDRFVDGTVKLYQDKALWQKAQQNGIKILNERYSKEKFAQPFINHVESIDLSVHRQNNFFGQILNHHTTQSTKYFSLWIQEKNKK